MEGRCAQRDHGRGPACVTVPFQSIVGGGDSQVFAAQTREWHRDIHSVRKAFVLLDASTGADGHC